MKLRKNNSESGFTLIEVIITIVVVAIVAAMMTAYFGTGITQSSLPIFRLSEAAKLNEIMEKITAEYDQIPRWSPETPYTTLSIVIPPPTTIRTGYRYKCTAGGTSQLKTAPALTWRTDNTEFPDGTLVKWIKDNVICAPTLDGTCPATGCTTCQTGLQSLIAKDAVAESGEVGLGEGHDYTQTFNLVSTSYRLIHNRFIKFKADNKEDEVNICTQASCLSVSGQNVYGKYLKVTIALPNTSSPTLTTLFVLR